MRKRCLILTAVFLWISTISLTTEAAAQGKADSTAALRPGSWSVQFQISNNFTLKSFEGTLLSAKRHFSAERALRFGISFSGTISDRDEEASSAGDTTGIINLTDVGSNDHSSTIRLQYLFYSTPSKKLVRFIGVGPVLGYSRRTSTSESPVGVVNQSSKTESFQTGWVVGVNAAFGVEWFALENISFIAEYGVDITYNWLKVTNKFSDANRVNTRIIRRRTFQVRPNAVKFGLSIYL